MGPAPVIHTYSDVTVGPHDGKSVVELHFVGWQTDTYVVVDRATAARLINQLRRELDKEYNDRINERYGDDAA